MRTYFKHKYPQDDVIRNHTSVCTQPGAVHYVLHVREYYFRYAIF